MDENLIVVVDQRSERLSGSCVVSCCNAGDSVFVCVDCTARRRLETSHRGAMTDGHWDTTALQRRRKSGRLQTS